MVDYTCIHEEQIQGQSRKIAELETRADYKDKRIDDLYVKIKSNRNRIRTPEASGNRKPQPSITTVSTGRSRTNHHHHIN